MVGSVRVTTGASPGPRPADSERPLGPHPRGKEDNKSLENATVLPVVEVRRTGTGKNDVLPD